MPRGGPRPGSGRPKGRQSRITPERKAFLRSFIEGTQEQALADWAAISNPADRFKLWLSAAEFVFPRMGRQELVGEAGAPITFTFRKPEGA